jgi:hypothetical protein
MSADIVLISEMFRQGTFITTNHAAEEMKAENISDELLEEAIGRDRPKIIDRGKTSYTVLGWGTEQDPIHAVIAHSGKGVIHTRYRLVTVYRPNLRPDMWMKGYEKKRLTYRIRQIRRRYRS